VETEVEFRYRDGLLIRLLIKTKKQDTHQTYREDDDEGGGETIELSLVERLRDIPGEEG
jgi:hypothetical protein